MHKDIEVLKLELNDNFSFKKIIKVFDTKHLPFSTEQDIKTSQSLFVEWWNDRSIPITRDEYKNIKTALPNDDSASLVIKAHALSLDDQYWIKKEDEDISYDDVSFFSNKFSNDIGDVIVGHSSSKKIDYYSPDSTSTGNLKKRWKIIDGEKYLLKAGTKPYQYEIFNEIIASIVMDILEIDHIEYKLIIDNEEIYCGSKNFVNYNEDLVTAYQLKNSKKQNNNVSLYEHLLSIYKSLNIPDYKKKLNQMLLVDYLLANSDRHLNNFGVIRDAKSLEFLRIAPIYDTGSCLGFDVNDKTLENLDDVNWKPFKTKRIKTQLDLIDDCAWLNFYALLNAYREVDLFLLKNRDYIPDARRNAIKSLIMKRIVTITKRFNLNDDNHNYGYELSTLEKDIIKYVEANEYELRDLNELMKKTGYSYITIYRAVSSLVNKQILRRVGSRKTGYWVKD